MTICAYTLWCYDFFLICQWHFCCFLMMSLYWFFIYNVDSSWFCVVMTFLHMILIMSWHFLCKFLCSFIFMLHYTICVFVFLIFILQDNGMFHSMWCDLNLIQICVGRIKTSNFHMWWLKGDDMKRFQHGINYHPKNDTPSLELFKLMHGYLKFLSKKNILLEKYTQNKCFEMQDIWNKQTFI